MRPGPQVMASLPWFTGLTPGQLAAFDDIADLTRVGPDEELLRAGEAARDLTILLSGFVAETCPRRSTAAIVDIIGPVAAIGLAPALLGDVSPTGARTITGARLVTLSAEPLRALLHARPALGMPLLHHALTALRTAQKDIRGLKLQSAAQRLADFLLGLIPDRTMSPARFVLPYEKRHLAARIGCSQENLSRAFGTLRDVGVETQRSVVVVRDVARLRDFGGAWDSAMAETRAHSP